MFEGLKNGWSLFTESFKVFAKYPSMIFPLMLVWAVYAPMILYLRYGINWKNYGLEETLLIVFGFTFVFAFLLAFSCSMLLEMIEHVETGREPNILEAFVDTLGFNLVRMIPLVVVWTIIWFLLIVIEAIVRRKNEDTSEEAQQLNARNAARTLAGMDGSFSFSGAFFEALRKGVRMIVFLILPGIAWQGLGCWDAVKKGFRVFSAHLSEFVTGFVLTELAAAIIFTPPAVIFFLGSEGKNHRPPIIDFPDYVWMGTIIYIAFAWSYTIYLEQMFTAELYMWHLKWEKEVEAKREHPDFSYISLSDVPRPSILDGVPDLLDRVPAYARTANTGFKNSIMPETVERGGCPSESLEPGGVRRDGEPGGFAPPKNPWKK